MLLMTVVITLSTATQGLKVEELSDDPWIHAPLPVFPPISYQILNAESLFLSETNRYPMGNSSLQAQRQSFILTGLSGQPAINASYGPMSVEQVVPLDLIHTGPRVRPFILTRQVRSSAPLIRLLFQAVGRKGFISEGTDQTDPGQNDEGFICMTAYAFWETREVRTTCSVPADGGFCLAHLKPEPMWFSPGSTRSSREQRGEMRNNIVELYYQTRPSPTSHCTPQDSKQRKGPIQMNADSLGSTMKRIGKVSLLRSPPGNPTFMRLRLGGAVVIQTSSKPLRPTDTATFYVFLSSISPVEHFILRATVRKGISFSTARPSDSHLWDIVLEPERGSSPQTISVICQRKTAVSGKRGLLEVLQLDFETEESSDQSASQVITWRLELPGNRRDEGVMKIYTTPKDYVGMTPLLMETELLNTAVLTGKKVTVPVRVLAVEADGSITDITNSTRCQSTDEEVLKVSESCDYVFMNGEETRGKTRMTVNFTYSYLSAQLELSVWMPHLPLQIEMSDPELSQIKGWRVPVTSGKRMSWDSEEEEERKGKGCMLQYQQSLVRVLTVFSAETSDLSTDPNRDPNSSALTFFLGPEWQVDITRLVRYSLRVKDPSIARLQGGTVLSGKSVGVTTIQVVSPLSEAVLAERMVRVLDDKVSITELGVQLVSGLSLSLQLSPGSNRAIIATATTKEVLQSPKQEAVVGLWIQFSDGSLTPLDLFDPSGYTLTVTSLNERVVSVRKESPPFSVVAEGEGQGLLLRAELAICEACQKSKRKSKLAVGGGTIKAEFQSGWEHGEIVRVEEKGGSDYGNDGGVPEKDSKMSLSSSRGLQDNLSNTLAGLQESVIRMVTSSTRSTLQEAAGVDISTMNPINRAHVSTTIKPSVDKVLVTVGRGGTVRRNYGNLVDGSDFPSQVEMPKKRPPLVKSDLVRTFGALTDLEVGMYSLIGVSCLAIVAFVLNCASYRLRVRNKKSPVQNQGPPEHRHHWVRLGSALEHVTTVPVAAACKQGLPRDIHSAVGTGEERTATLGRRCNTLPPRPHPTAGRSATLLAKPVRTEPLHSPTSKRNQVQFTTFTTLDIKHLTALKRNGLDINWSSQAGGCGQSGACIQTGNGTESKGYLSDVPWPVVQPGARV
ncbi:transmembrane protein 132D [Chanos chanos]|uniref:Transmembrane protein 132D n=1 Tax=Chanos chanos TaxID=29144 RepID=A0A6J2UVY8_CHACN|nr:transmembrane protein 132D-like [Chanos chanos]